MVGNRETGRTKGRRGRGGKDRRKDWLIMELAIFSGRSRCPNRNPSGHFSTATGPPTQAQLYVLTITITTTTIIPNYPYADGHHITPHGDKAACAIRETRRGHPWLIPWSVSPSFGLFLLFLSFLSFSLFLCSLPFCHLTKIRATYRKFVNKTIPMLYDFVQSFNHLHTCTFAYLHICILAHLHTCTFAYFLNGSWTVVVVAWLNDWTKSYNIGIVLFTNFR